MRLLPALCCVGSLLATANVIVWAGRPPTTILAASRVDCCSEKTSWQSPATTFSASLISSVVGTQGGVAGGLPSIDCSDCTYFAGTTQEWCVLSQTAPHGCLSTIISSVKE